MDLLKSVSIAARARWLGCVSFALLATTAFGQSAVDTAVQAANTPLVGVAIATRESVCVAKTYGPATDEPLRMHAASISKIFTALVIVQLQEEGKLTLTDSVGKYVAEFNQSPITLAQLLTHTSGLVDRDRADGRKGAKEVDDYFTSLAKQRPDRKHDWRYADANFNLLGRVIERIVQAPYGTVLNARLLAPLGMSQSTFNIDDIPVDNRAVAFRKTRVLPHPWDAAFVASSGLQTTAGDLAKFAQAMLTVHAGEHLPYMVTAASLTEMTQQRMPTKWSGVMQGFGWQVSKTEFGVQWRHAGGEQGFESLLAIYPERGFAIVVMGNREDWPRFQLESKLRTFMAEGAVSCER